MDGPLRRVVVWLMLKGHMQAFCWDQVYDGYGDHIKDILYIMTTMHQKDFVFDPHVNDHIIAEFKEQMVAAGHITERVTLIPELKCRSNLRSSMIDNTPDIACVAFTAFSTFFLLNVLDIEDWDGLQTDARKSQQIDQRFWQSCRIGYANFEKRMLDMIDMNMKAGKAIWICPELQACHVNINDVYLIAVDKAGAREKLTYDWDAGWTSTRM